MKRAFPWILAAILFLAFGASFSELQRMRTRFGEVTQHRFHDHQDVREFMIRTELDGLDRPVVLLGDSIAEMAKLPETICGRTVVNAGIGGATTAGFLKLAPVLLENSRPSLVVIALGANDGGNPSLRNDSERLVSIVKKLSDRVIVVPTTALPGETLEDGIHLTRAAYQRWTPSLVRNIASSIGCND